MDTKCTVTELNSKELLLTCPMCRMQFVVAKNEINCKIFRCGYLKTNLKQIPPHLTKKECDELVITNSVFGCCAPFELSENMTQTFICSYDK